MKTEVENILIENMQQSDKYVSVAAIRSSLIKYGNYGLITRLLWKPVGVRKALHSRSLTVSPAETKSP